MNGMKLASCGDDVKLWDCNDFSLVKQYNPHDDNVCALSWSYDGTKLSSVATQSEKISIYSVGNSVVPIAELQCGVGQLCVDYCNVMSRYMLCGGNDQTITVWDLKSRQIKKSYKNHKGPVTCARFNKDDTHIASGSQSGEIIVYNVVTGQGCRPMVAPKVHAIQQIQYSKCKKSLLGAASDDGAINLWDTNTRQLIHGFSSAHRSPATGLNFSPINDILLMSVGLDKRIIYYDLKSKKPVSTKISERPLTSIDVMNDGITVATGSINGKVFIYDLRKGNAPIKILNAHKSSVQTLKFQNTNTNAEQITESKERAVIQSEVHTDVSPPNRRQLPPAPESRQVTQDYADSFNATHNVMSTNMSDDVFSPLHGIGDGTSPAHLTDRFRHSASNSGLQGKQDFSGGMFSPLEEPGGSRHRFRDSYNDMSPLGHQPLTTSQPLSSGIHSTLSQNGVHQEDTGLVSESFPDKSPEQSGRIPDYVSNDGSPRLPVNPTYVTATSNSRSPKGHSVSFQDLSNKSPNSQSNSYNSYSNNIKSSVPSFSASGAQTFETMPSSIPSFSKLDESPSGSAGADFCQHRLLSSPEGAQTVSASTGSRLRNSQDSYRSPPASAASQSGTNFQTEFIRNLIREELEEFRDQMHSEMSQLFIEMVRQTTRQTNEIRQMIEYYSVNSQLMAELEHLKEENKRLKKNF